MMNEMNMQEPERERQSDPEWQVNQPYGEYRAGYSGSYEQEPGQQQKIYPQTETEQRGAGAILGVLAILVSSIGFFLALAGIVGAAVVLKFANGQTGVLAGGVIGLISSILVLLLFVAIFVIAVIVLARPYVIRNLRRPGVRSRWR